MVQCYSNTHLVGKGLIQKHGASWDPEILQDYSNNGHGWIDQWSLDVTIEADWGMKGSECCKAGNRQGTGQHASPADDNPQKEEMCLSHCSVSERRHHNQDNPLKALTLWLTYSFRGLVYEKHGGKQTVMTVTGEIVDNFTS